MQDSIVKEIWGKGVAGWCGCDAIGSAGGILIIWNNRSFTVRDWWIAVFSVSVLLEEISSGSVRMVTSVYGPTDRRLRESFWEELDSIRMNWTGPWCIGGDWSVVTFLSGKLGGNTFSADMIGFSDWINKHSLLDLQLGGAKFNWSNHQWPPAMSRLDRFCISSDWLELFPEVCQIALPNPISNHCPILLTLSAKDGGPLPFVSNLCGSRKVNSLVLSEIGGKI